MNDWAGRALGTGYRSSQQFCWPTKHELIRAPSNSQTWAAIRKYL
jgi:hypothetical protein